MCRYCVSLMVVLFTTKTVALSTNTNIYYKSSFIQDENKAKELWLELEDEKYINSSMIYSVEEAKKAIEQSRQKYDEYESRRVQNISFDFSLFGETVRNVHFGDGDMILAEKFTADQIPLYAADQLTDQQYFTSITPNFEINLAQISLTFIRWFHNDSQFTVTWEFSDTVELKFTVAWEYSDTLKHSKLGNYMYQITLFKTGDIAIVFKATSNKNGVRNIAATLKDGYMMSNKTIHKYDHHSFKLSFRNTKNWSLIYLKQLTTCLSHKDVDSCLSFHMNCTWCTSAKLCTSDEDRILRKWIINNCDTGAISKTIHTKTNVQSITLFQLLTGVLILVFICCVVGQFTRLKLRRRRPDIASEMKVRKPQIVLEPETEIMTQWKKRITILVLETEKTSGDGDPLNIPIVKIEKYKTGISAASLSLGYMDPSEYEMPRDDIWEFPRQSLLLGRTLGEGAFGKVLQAEAQGILKPDTVTTVAVKMLREDHLDTEMIALVSEVEVMKMIGKHNNIINLLGVCSQDGPLFVIVEFAPHNNLKDFLRKHRPLSEYDNELESQNSAQMVLSVEDLVSYASQVANGMQYLHSKKCLHRDLAARNILVSDEHIMKIADFGLARDIHSQDYYRIASRACLPYKWMAPESLSQYIFKYESDVWSYGVLLWEIMTFGEAPYPSSIYDIKTMLSFLRSGSRLEKPPHCPDEIYDVMQECWNYEAADRPQFNQLVLKLDNRMYLTVETKKRESLFQFNY